MDSPREQARSFGIAYLGGISFKDDPKQVRLFEFRLRCRECFRTVGAYLKIVYQPGITTTSSFGIASNVARSMRTEEVCDNLNE